MISQLPGGKFERPETLTVGGISTTRMNRVELAEQMVIDTRLARAGKLKQPRIVVSSNGAVIAAYHRDQMFQSSIRQADIVDADGMPLVFATKIMCKRPLRERVATTDFLLDAAAAAEGSGTRFYFLGAQPELAETAAANLRLSYRKLEIVGTRHGYFKPEEEDAICRDIVASGADILWLGLGSPRQEAFAIRNRAKLAGLAWIRTCGGLFDFYSDEKPRAPAWMQRIGLEWLFRGIREPRRLGIRYLLTNPAAVYHLATKTHD